MAKTRMWIAILLALSLVVSPTTSLLADGPSPTNLTSPNPLEGHPWDDEAVESDPDPGTDPNTPGLDQAPRDGSTLTLVTTTASVSGAQFFAGIMRVVFDKWIKVSESKVTKSKTGRRMR